MAGTYRNDVQILLTAKDMATPTINSVADHLKSFGGRIEKITSFSSRGLAAGAALLGVKATLSAADAIAEIYKNMTIAQVDQTGENTVSIIARQIPLLGTIVEIKDKIAEADNYAIEQQERLAAALKKVADENRWSGFVRGQQGYATMQDIAFGADRDMADLKAQTDAERELLKVENEIADRRLAASKAFGMSIAGAQNEQEIDLLRSKAERLDAYLKKIGDEMAGKIRANQAFKDQMASINAVTASRDEWDRDFQKVKDRNAAQAEMAQRVAEIEGRVLDARRIQIGQFYNDQIDAAEKANNAELAATLRKRQLIEQAAANLEGLAPRTAVNYGSSPQFARFLTGVRERANEREQSQLERDTREMKQIMSKILEGIMTGKITFVDARLVR